MVTIITDGVMGWIDKMFGGHKMDLISAKTLCVKMDEKRFIWQRECEALCNDITKSLRGKEVTYRFLTEIIYHARVVNVILDHDRFVVNLRDKQPNGQFSDHITRTVPISKILSVTASQMLTLAQQSQAREDLLSL